jgi:hypothetical protein
VSQKATELTSPPYISALQAVRKRKRYSQIALEISGSNSREWNGYCVFYMTVGSVKYARRFQRTAWSGLCLVRSGVVKTVLGLKNDKYSFFASTSSKFFFWNSYFLRISTKKQVSKLMYGGTATFTSCLIVFSILLVSSRILLPNCELQVFVLCYKIKQKTVIHTYIFDYSTLLVTFLVTDNTFTK